jgi:hypothetical protein
MSTHALPKTADFIILGAGVMGASIANTGSTSSASPANSAKPGSSASFNPANPKR